MRRGSPTSHFGGFIKQFFARFADEGGDGGGGAGDSGDGGGSDDGIATASVSMSASEDTSFPIPDEYKESPWAKDIDSPDKLWKQYANAQTLIGKKAEGVTIPAADAPDDKWQEYYKSTRPESAEAYTFSEPEYDDSEKEILKHLGSGENPEFAKEVKEIFHRNGLTQKQADSLQKEYSKALIKNNAAQLQAVREAQEKQNADFDTLANSTFKGDKDKALAISKGMIETFAPPELKQYLQGADNSQLVAVAAILKNVHDKYGLEDDIKGGSSLGTSAHDIRKQASTLMASKEYQDQFHPNHENVRKQVNSLYQELGRRPQK